MKNRWSEKERDGERWMDGHKIYRSRDRDRQSEDINVDIKR